VLTYLGIVTGHILIHYTETLKRLTRFLLYSILWASIALALCQLKWDDSAWLPINKNLWSLSYVFLMASISLFTFTVFFLLMDVYDVYSGTPFIYLGRNSIVVYLGHEILANAFPLFKVPDEHVYSYEYLLGYSLDHCSCYYGL
jgi:heparan-alpha-glucosaminide N-acetyltransferase